MKRLNNIEFANILLLELKKDFKKNPTHNKLDFEYYHVKGELNKYENSN